MDDEEAEDSHENERYPPSPDQLAIETKAKRWLGWDDLWRQSLTRDPRLAAAAGLQEEIDLLAEMLNGGWARARPRRRTRALRILVRRFGKLGAKRLIDLTMEVSTLELRLTLRPRTDKERHDGGKARREIDQDIEDYRLLAEVHRLRAEGLANNDAIMAAAKKVLGTTSGGIEGARKAMTRARKRAQRRGYADPSSPFVAFVMGGPAVAPKLSLANLRGPGRPKNTTKPK